MKKIALLAAACLLVSQANFAQNPSQNPSQNFSKKISPELQASFSSGETADLLLIFREKADLRAAKNLKSKTAKAEFVFQKLRETAARSQAEVSKILVENKAFANSLFMVNAIAVERCDARLAEILAARPEILSLEPDPEIHFSGAVEQSIPTIVGRGAVEWGVEKVSAPAMWALGFTGQNIIVGGADTGYDWQHPALKNSYSGFDATKNETNHNYHWHDAIHEKSPLNFDPNNPCGYSRTSPCDDQSHGTHTMGSMTGDDGAGNQIGVAPGARWVGCRNMERGWGKPSSYIECFQWFLAPTDTVGNLPRPDLAPHVINNSWYCSFDEGCTSQAVNELIHDAVKNLKASGVVVVVSNGNFGPACSTGDNPPAYFEESFSVGATRDDDWIAGFSSRGPVVIDSSFRIKPNVCAPGQNVRSSIPGGNYANFSGTSMAGPHVVGVVALLLSAHPQLAGNVDVIEDILEATAVFTADTVDCQNGSLGANQPNHTFGWGRVDALRAHEFAKTLDADEPAAADFVSVSPNPSSGIVFFNFKNLGKTERLLVFDAAGRAVFSEKIVAAGSLRVDLSGLAGGFYFWKIGSAAGKLVLKLD